MTQVILATDKPQLPFLPLLIMEEVLSRILSHSDYHIGCVGARRYDANPIEQWDKVGATQPREGVGNVISPPHSKTQG